ncbi:MAG: hypothetical protein OXH00_19955 [Candidatus Poribacteria bacterium]|nr:hypothetical protein [Candidatus Poribacteria bacterium]
MFSILDIFYLVFSQLAVGGFVLLFLVPKGLVGANFYRLMGSIYLLVSVLSRCADLARHRQSVTFLNFFGFWQNPESILVISFVLILLLYTLSWWFKSPLFTRLLFFSGVICGVAWIVLSAQRYFQIVQLPGEMFLLPLQFLTASVLLGTVNSGMWFGHWYLVVPDLPVVYLKRFNTVLLYTLLGMGLLLSLNIFFRRQSTDVVSFNLFYQIIFGMRLLIGIAGTLLLYFITWDCLRPKSVARDVLGATRAATGFLFIAIITVFLGEFCSRFLLLEMQFIF